jgi:hypothetical protein
MKEEDDETASEAQVQTLHKDTWYSLIHGEIPNSAT